MRKTLGASMQKSKVKVNRASNGDVSRSNEFDRCQTPSYALDPILPYLSGTVWECAAGEGSLSMALVKAGFKVVASDILRGQDFFRWQPESFDCIVTNPPYSSKFKWLEKCYQLNKPFALLLPVETIGANKAQRLFEKHGVEVVFMNRRINFKMPRKGLDGAGAWFPTAWFTNGLGIGQQMTFAKIEYRIDEQMSLFPITHPAKRAPELWESAPFQALSSL